MNQIEFNTKIRQETKLLSIAVIHFYKSLPKTDECRIIGKQLLRSATSVGANFRAVCRARSVREKFAKLSIVIEEADETLFWLELLQESNTISAPTTLFERSLMITKTLSSYRKKMKQSR